MDLALDQNHDISFSDTGHLATVTGPALVAQRIKVALNTQLGEWLLDTGAGFDWRGTVFVHAPSLPLIRARLAVLLRGVPGVTRLQKLELGVDRKTRRLEVNFAVATTEGVLEATGEQTDAAGAMLALLFRSGGVLIAGV